MALRDLGIKRKQDLGVILPCLWQTKLTICSYVNVHQELSRKTSSCEVINNIGRSLCLEDLA